MLVLVKLKVDLGASVVLAVSTRSDLPPVDNSAGVFCYGTAEIWSAFPSLESELEDMMIYLWVTKNFSAQPHGCIRPLGG